MAECIERLNHGLNQSRSWVLELDPLIKSNAIRDCVVKSDPQMYKNIKHKNEIENSPYTTRHNHPNS